MSNREHIHIPGNLGDTIADAVTKFFGTWLCLGLHTVWFVVWFLFRLDVSLLTNIVSLEAIGLAILIMMSQGRQSDKDELRDNLESEEVAEIYKSHELLLTLNQQQLEILELLRGDYTLSATPG